MDLSHLDADCTLIDDDQEAVRLRFPIGDPDEGPDIEIGNALWRILTRREMDASKGAYRSGDIACTVPRSQCTREPTPGAYLVDAQDTEWTVLETRSESNRSVIVCVCRNLIISERLDNLITIQIGTFAKANGGAEQAEWTDLHTNVRARIQPEGGREGQQHGSRQIRRKYTVFVREPFVLRREHRIVDAAGKIYRVMGFDHPDRIDRLMEISCEDFPGA